MGIKILIYKFLDTKTEMQLMQHLMLRQVQLSMEAVFVNILVLKALFYKICEILWLKIINC